MRLSLLKQELLPSDTISSSANTTMASTPFDAAADLYPDTALMMLGGMDDDNNHHLKNCLHFYETFASGIVHSAHGGGGEQY
jgi:hypothetical protein